MKTALMAAGAAVLLAGASTPAGVGGPDAPLFEERFTDGTADLAWQTFPRFSPDLPEVVRAPDAPSGDGWAGLVTNATFGGFASLAYAGDALLADYSVEAWVRVDVTEAADGPLQGIAVRVDPEGERFYRLAARFGAEPELTLAYVGRDVNHFPVHLGRWGRNEVPGGVPLEGGWHVMGLEVAGDRISASWNGVRLPGSAIVDARIARGYVGIYTNFVGGQQPASTLVDRLVVRLARPFDTPTGLVVRLAQP